MEAVLTDATLSFPVAEASQVYAARRGGGQLAQSLGFDETEAGKLAIMITEACTNMIKHAGRGELLLRALEAGDVRGIEVVALDSGPGITNLGESLRDGVSTTASAGTGLGAMRRLASDFDIYSLPGKGTALYMTLWPKPGEARPAGLQFSAVCIPIPGEEVCGDAWAVYDTGRGATLLVADGLGHGPAAAVGARAAAEIVKSRSGLSPAHIIDLAHGALRSTRGAALSVSAIDFSSGKIHFAGVGNVATSIHGPAGRRQLLSHNGIVGHNMRKVQQYEEAWPRNAVLVMHSDGLGTQWDLRQYPGLETRHPALIAGILYRDFSRRRDDVTVLVAR